MRDGDFRQRFADQPALDRIVVEKDHGVRAEREGGGNRGDVGRLVVPICLENRDVIFLKQHLGMAAEGQARRCVVVFGRHRQHDAAIAQRQRRPLYLEIGLAGCVALPEDDALDAVVADDAAPHRIVEIEDQASPALAAERADEPRAVLGVERKILAVEREFSEIPLLGRMPIAQSHGFGQTGDVEEDVLTAANALDQRGVECVHERTRRSGYAAVETSEQRLRRRRQRLYDAERLPVRAETVPKASKESERRVHAAERNALVSRIGAERKSAIIEREEHGIRLPTIDARIGVERFLRGLSEIRRHTLERDAVTRRAPDEQRYEIVERPISHDGELERRQGLERPPRRGRLADRTRQLPQLVFVQRVTGESRERVTRRVVRTDHVAASLAKIGGRLG